MITFLLIFTGFALGSLVTYYGDYFIRLRNTSLGLSGKKLKTKDQIYNGRKPFYLWLNK